MLAAVVGVTAVSFALLPCYLRRTARNTLSLRLAASESSANAAREQLGQYIDSVSMAAAALRDGKLVAFPTETVYGLGAHAFDARACARIFEVKGRPRSDPLIVHVHTPQAAEQLVQLQAEGLDMFRRLSERFWPGPLTIVAPACAALPVEVTSGSGFVGVRCPHHKLAIQLLEEAAVPVAAPSANRFGHVSPTRPEHVMDDLGAHAIYVLRHSESEGCCAVGIESTVLKLNEPTRQLILLRRGGVPEAELARWLQSECSSFSLLVQVAHKAHEPQQLSSQPEEPLLSPGSLLTHYSPDVPSFLVSPRTLDSVSSRSMPIAGQQVGSLNKAVVLDFGARMQSTRSMALHYKVRREL